MPKSFPVRANIILTLALLATTISCQQQPEGPTAAQAEGHLRAHVDKLAGIGVGNIRNARVTDPGGKDISCDEDRVKRTYAVAGHKKDPRKDDLSLDPVDLSNNLYGKLNTLVAKYEPVDVQRASPIIKSRNKQARTNITIAVPQKGVVEIYGSTDCLRKS
ncbi:hypothetical protein [Actinomadura kijaniata]|uniref:hypothetical protein n=1 Tax=Actinomadura kijaniata TaxID=46161 RepID=UPI0012F7F71F|nr:hypothetical protein [Actinomadura kijaniata]